MYYTLWVMKYLCTLNWTVKYFILTGTLNSLLLIFDSDISLHVASKKVTIISNKNSDDYNHDNKSKVHFKCKLMLFFNNWRSFAYSPVLVFLLQNFQDRC